MGSLPRDWNSGGSASVDGAQKPSVRSLLSPWCGITLAELAAIDPGERSSGQVARVGTTQDNWYFNPDSALTSDGILVQSPTVGNGRWLRQPGQWVTLALPFSFATADTAALLTAQAGQQFAAERFHWAITASMTGGTNSAIGLSSNKSAPTDWTTKGDLHGGATGDLAAGLTAGFKAGTIGADMDTITKVRGLVLVSGDVIRYDRIASAFTAGSGFALAHGYLIRNDGA